MGSAHLDEVLDLGVLDEHVRQGRISRVEHPSGELCILDYQPIVQFKRLWDRETLTCRGLIVDRDGNIVARPFRKFFNHGEPEADEIGTDFTVHEKLDGSLGILYRDPDGNLSLSTRGSFSSEQAKHGTEMLRADHPHFEPPEGVTVLFEIIYPQNRIVVDYGNESKLVALGAIDNRTGADVPVPDSWDGPVAPTYDPVPLDVLVDQTRAGTYQNQEGFVLVGCSDGGPNPRVKVKHAEYVRLHRIMTGISNVTVWFHAAIDDIRGSDTDLRRVASTLRMPPETVAALLAQPDPIEHLCVTVPDELHTWVQDEAAQFRATVAELLRRHQQALADRRVRGAKDRKARAAAIFQIAAEENLDRTVLFGLVDGRDMTARLWRLARPAFARPFRSNADL